MKTDRHNRSRCQTRVKQDRSRRFVRIFGTSVLVAVAAAMASLRGSTAADGLDSAADPNTTAGQASAEQRAVSHQRASKLLEEVIRQFADGPPFIAKVRETVWATGREVVGVGTYEQAGQGSGQFNLQITMHDGDGKHQLQQISDGRLAWTRSEISGNVTLRRVDVGRLDEWIRKTIQPPGVNPRLKVGGWTEMLDSVGRDHWLRVDGATLEGQRVWVITGQLRKEIRQLILAESGRSEWPPLYPTKVRVAIASQDDPETGMGRLLPRQIQFWSDPIASTPDSTVTPEAEGRLITLIEIYSVRPINSPPPERFRFDNQDAEVNFINETDRYLDRFGIELTAGERQTLQR